MTKIMFVCYGNICRSPMAEFIMKDIIQKRNLEKDFFVASSATSTEEIGSPVYPSTKKILAQLGISCEDKRAVQLKRSDFDSYDFIIGMESANVTRIQQILNQSHSPKIKRLLDFTPMPKDIDDPWYTRDFQQTYRDVSLGCNCLLDYIISQTN